MKIHLTDQPGKLEQCLQAIECVDSIAADLEFDKNYYRYGFNLCLIQIFTGTECYLIDPLDDKIDMDGVFRIFEDDDISKTVFAFGEDLRLLHSLGCFPKNIYDLNIATSLLNYPPSSLSNYLSDLLDIKTAKSAQKSNWFNRPLTDEQIQYAAEDVIHLLKLRKIIEMEAAKRDIDSWINEENKLLDQLDYSDEDDKSLTKQKDMYNMSEFCYHIYHRLMEYRDEVAQKLDKPAFKIAPAKELAEIAQHPGLRHQLESGIDYPGILKRKAYTVELNRIIEESIEFAHQENYSKTAAAAEKNGMANKRIRKPDRNEIREAKNQFFKPVKNRISAIYGKETASFILSNRIINSLVTGEKEYLLSYKRDLILSVADELKLDSATYFPEKFRNGESVLPE